MNNSWSLDKVSSFCFRLLFKYCFVFISCLHMRWVLSCLKHMFYAQFDFWCYFGPDKGSYLCTFLAAAYPVPLYNTPGPAPPADSDANNTTVSQKYWSLLGFYVSSLILTIFFFYCRFLLVTWILMSQKRSWSKPFCSLGKLSTSRFLWAKDVVLYSLGRGLLLAWAWNLHLIALII